MPARGGFKPALGGSAESGKKTIFSGIRPSGELHLGNYFGALKNWVDLQNKSDNQCIFCIVDYHAITTPFDPKEIKDRIFNTAVDYLAAGLDPKKSIIFVQSQVPEHTELAWILNTITPVNELQRMTQFKDKSKMHKESVNMGLFDYPVLMAADILIYQADLVPVGEDQYQHVELTRAIARKFNNAFGEFFKIPEIYKSVAPRVMS
ncbi:MAG: tryptophan--tRNA ligase, partial [bacterium]